jgi:hypothetical protein
MPAGVERHASRAVELLVAIHAAGQEQLAGLTLTELITFGQQVAAMPVPESLPESGPLFSSVLEPK